MDFPNICAYYASSHEWKIRSYTQQQPTVGRWIGVKPKAGARFYLRILLTLVTGATSFEDVRTAVDNNGVATVHQTFKQACFARGLLETDDEYHRVMEEVAQVHTISLPFLQAYLSPVVPLFLLSFLCVQTSGSASSCRDTFAMLRSMYTGDV